ncbi:JAB domain-containing protein [Empedobacter sp. GD03739]|uniref:JAB domain-containing protein n=1 Tax=Empedobacter sp. GD03739 TaxID=2975376 RepID=UPI002449385E|nr:JAB domain-containing protein [Empedobacter sp. GD03739]MDH1602181.1 JAB domain-containing protein [Empedobacter sp. GD03739]
MKVSEIKISYMNEVDEKIKVLGSSEVYQVLKANWDLDIIELQEEFKILLLNQGNQVLGIKSMFKGGINTCSIDVRLIMGMVLKANASALVITHNHPSGNLNASESDKRITSKIKECCELFDIRLLDHIIMAKNSYLSFADEGIL